MDKEKFGINEELFDISDSDDSSSSSNAPVFQSHQPFVLDLHDLVKDEPPAGTNLGQPVVKKQKKKKRLSSVEQSPSGEVSSSVSESSVPPTGLEEHSREEFYDAHESYHGLTENQLVTHPVAAAGVMQARSENSPVIKPELAIQQTPEQTQPESASRREPSTITKPSIGPQ